MAKIGTVGDLRNAILDMTDDTPILIEAGLPTGLDKSWAGVGYRKLAPMGGVWYGKAGHCLLLRIGEFANRCDHVSREEL